MNINKALQEMSIEIGQKDGKAGFRSFVNNNMIEKSPPEHLNLGNKIIAWLTKQGIINKFTKFDANEIDITRNADGSIILNPEEGVSITLNKIKVDEILK